MNDVLTNYFATVLAASMSIAGLAGLISLFKSSETFHREEIYLLRSVILWSMCIGLGAILPFAFFTSLASSKTIWTLCSLIFTVVGLVLLGQELIQLRNKRIVYLYRISYSLLGLILALCGWAALNSLLWHAPDVYVWGLIGGLVAVGSRLVLILQAITEPVLKS